MFIYCDNCKRIHAFYYIVSTHYSDCNVDPFLAEITEYESELKQSKTENVCPVCSQPCNRELQYTSFIEYETKESVSKLFKRALDKNSRIILNNIILEKLSPKQLLKVKEAFKL